AGPFPHKPEADYRRVAEGLVALLRDEGGDALTDRLRERGIPDAPTFADRRALLLDWFDPPAAGAKGTPAAEEENVDEVPVTEEEGREEDPTAEEDTDEVPPAEALPESTSPTAPQRAFARSVAGAHPSF